MVVVGADVHKQTHTFVAVDEVGRKLGEKTVKALAAGHAEAVMWARERFGAELVWAIEDCRHLSARLERDLMGFGQKVVRVPPKLMAQARASARTRGKSDPIDALAVARAFLREPDLPVASHDEVSRELKLLVDRREVLVAQRTATINRLRWRVHELDPERAPKPLSLDLAKHRRLLGDWLATVSGLLAELARDELADIIRLSEAINELAKRIGDRVRHIAPVLLTLPGCGETDRGQARRRIGRGDPIQKRSRFRPPCRGGTGTCVVGQHRWTGPDDSLGQPTTQRRTAPHRSHPDPSQRSRTGLLPPPPRRQRLHPRSAALPQTPPLSNRLSPPAHRPTKPNSAPTSSGLT
jgi:transposase